MISKELEKYIKTDEERKRVEEFLDILFEIDSRNIRRRLKEQQEQQEKQEKFEEEIGKREAEKFKKISSKATKTYNLTQTARILGVHRQTIYYWIKKKWVKPKRDFKGYPVFTVLDIERLIDWKNTLKIDDFRKRKKCT